MRGGGGGRREEVLKVKGRRGAEKRWRVRGRG